MVIYLWNMVIFHGYVPWLWLPISRPSWGPSQNSEEETIPPPCRNRWVWPQEPLVASPPSPNEQSDPAIATHCPGIPELQTPAPGPACLHTMVETWEIHGRFMENNRWSWNITITITYYNRWYNQLYMQLEWLIVGLPDLSFHLWPMKNRTVWLTSGWNVVPYFQTKGDKCWPDEDYHFTVSLSTSSPSFTPNFV